MKKEKNNDMFNDALAQLRENIYSHVPKSGMIEIGMDFKHLIFHGVGNMGAQSSDTEPTVPEFYPLCNNLEIRLVSKDEVPAELADREDILESVIPNAYNSEAFIFMSDDEASRKVEEALLSDLMS